MFMETWATLDAAARNAKRRRAIRSSGAGIALVALSGLTVPAHAVDGCLVLLCFAAPSWRAVPQCVPPVRQVLRDLARGRAFPTCGMAGAGNSAEHAWADAPHNCPPHYTRVQETETGTPVYRCYYAGAVSVSIARVPFARTWWNFAGDSVTEFSDAAKAQLGQWDTRFDDEQAAWRAALPVQATVSPDPGDRP
jgi:hypothetical protein